MKQQTFNLQESPFRDMTKTSSRTATVNYTAGLKYNLPTFDDNIEWEIIKPRSIFQQSKVAIPDKKHNQIIDEIIKLYKYNYGNGYKIQDNKILVQLIQNNQKMINQRNQEGHVKASYVGYVSCSCPPLSKYFQGSIFYKRLCEGTTKTKYPLGFVELGARLISSDPFNRKIRDQGISYFEIAIQYGEPHVFSFYGSVCRQLYQNIQAYNYLKNAQLHGYIIAYAMLGQVFLYGDNITFQRNLYCAKRYFDLAKKTKVGYFEKNCQIDLINLDYELAQNAKIADSIISTDETQSKVIANFITNKFTEKKMLQEQNIYRSNFGLTNNFNSDGYHGVCFKKRTFYVVFAPQMVFPSRGFLGEDQNGKIQIVNIYKWSVIDQQKLRLLHKLGTKVVVNQYIRKYGANDHLPCYRIQNPYAVQIYPPTQKHSISDQKYRNFAKILFAKQLYKQAMAIYDHLICKKATNLQIVYSNKGLIYQNQNNIPDAILNYKKSLAIKKYQKSQLRLAYIYLNQQKFLQAKQITKQIQDQKQRQNLLKIIQQKQGKKIEAQQPITQANFQKMDINSIPFLKKQVKIQKLIGFNPNPQKVNENAATPLIGDIVKYIIHKKAQYSHLLGIDNTLSETQYMKQIQKIYDFAQLQIKEQNLPKFTKFFTFAYHQMQTYSQKQFYQQSLGYMLLYQKQCFSRPLIQVNLGIQFAATFGTRCNYLQNRLEDFCIQLQRKGNYDSIIKIYTACNNYCTLFCRKISEMFFNKLKNGDNIQYCNAIIKKLQQITDSKKVFQTKLFLTNQKIKSMIKLKMFEEGAVLGSEFIQKANKQNPKYQNIKINLSNYNEYLSDLTQKTNKCVKTSSCHLAIWNLKNNIALCYCLASKHKQALSFIDEKNMQKYFNEEKEMYFSTLLLKIKILLKSGHDMPYVIKLIQSSLKQLQNITDKKNKNYFKGAFLKFLLNHQLKNYNFKRVLTYCQKILQIGNQYGGYLVKRLLKFCVENQQKSIELLNKLKQTKILQIIYVNLYDQYKGYCYTKLKQKQKISQIIIQYLNLQQFLQKQQQIKQEYIQQYEQLQQYKYHYEKQKIQQQQQQPLQLQQINQDQNRFEGFRYVGKCKDNIDYIIYFDERMRLQKNQQAQFLISAQKICKSQKGHNGIKIIGNQARLKIKSAARLIGKIQEKDGRRYILFCKREGHDDYKRKR